MVVQVIEGQRDFVIQMNDKWNSFSLMKYDKFGHPFGCLKPNSARSYEELLLCIAEGENNEPEVVPSITPPNNGVLLIANVRTLTPNPSPTLCECEYRYKC